MDTTTSDKEASAQRSVEEACIKVCDEEALTALHAYWNSLKKFVCAKKTAPASPAHDEALKACLLGCQNDLDLHSHKPGVENAIICMAFARPSLN